MDNFYTTVVIVAVVVLLLALIGIGMMLQKQNKDVTFPLYANECPDAWVVDGSGCKIPSVSSLNYPSNSNAPTILATFNKNDNSGMYKATDGDTGAFLATPTIGANAVLHFNTAATTCQKRTWANDVGVSWDGITNYNKC